MAQAWYQGGVSVMDFTDPAKPIEIAYFDRGPINPERVVVGGEWSAYWFNGRIYGSEIARGMDILRLVPSEYLSAAEIAAAEAVQADVINPQTQTRIVWADSPDVANAYLDQLTRANAIEAGLAGRVNTAISQWRSGGRRDRAGATALSAALTTAAAAAKGVDATRLTALAGMFERRGR